MRLYVALVHFPIYDKMRNIITTSITNLDIHDIARSCATFAAQNFYIVHPLESQHALFKRIADFWKTEIAGIYNADRVYALERIRYVKTIDETIQMIKNQEGTDPIVVTTTATKMESQTSIGALYEAIINKDRPVLIVFGTGNGLADELHEKADYILKPIAGYSNYNHLSVRSAVAIVLDRFTSEEYKEE